MTMESMGMVPGPTRAEADREAYENAAEAAWTDGPEAVEHGIRCAHCKRHHATIQDVRWCANVEAEARAEAEAEMAAEAASEIAYARDRERIAENGTWFGPQTEADTWGED